MKRCTVTEVHLQEYFDDQLSTKKLRAMRDHVAECESCRANLRELELLRMSARSLGVDQQPERDLWPEIAQRLSTRGSSNRKLARVRRLTGIVVAATTVVTFAGFYAWLQRDLPPTQHGVEQAATTIADAELQAVEKEYGYTSRIVLAQFAAPELFLAPETMTALERNVEITDRALQELRAALAASPTDQYVRQRLIETYKKQAELFEQAIQLSVGVAED